MIFLNFVEYTINQIIESCTSMNCRVAHWVAMLSSNCRLRYGLYREGASQKCLILGGGTSPDKECILLRP